MMTKEKDEWDEINYPELTKLENEVIRDARRKGYAEFYPAYPDATTQSLKTLEGAQRFFKEETIK